MALTGDLSNIQLGDLLQTLDQNRQTGVLKIWSRGSTREIFFTPKGIALIEMLDRVNARLAEIFTNTDQISPEEIEECARLARELEVPLAKILLDRDLVSFEEVRNALVEQNEEEIYSLFGLTEGRFEFLAREDPPFEEDDVCTPAFFPVGAVLLEGARRMDEWDEIFRHIEDLYEIYAPVEVGKYIVEQLDEEERLVFAAIDGRSDVRAIADRGLGSIFETAKILGRFIQASYIRKTTEGELIRTAEELLRDGRKQNAHKILDLLITRREPTDHALLRHISDLYIALDDTGSAADLLCEVAQHLLDSERREEAEEILREVGRLAPLHLHSKLLLIELLREDDEQRREIFSLRIEAIGLLVNERREPEAATLCSDLLNTPIDDVDLLRAGAIASKRAGQAHAAVVLLHSCAEIEKEQGRPQKAADAYREILRIDRGDQQTATELKDLLISESAAKRRRWLIAVLTVVSAAAAIFAWWTISAHFQAHSMLAQAQELNRTGNEVKALGLVKRIQTEFSNRMGAANTVAEARDLQILLERKIHDHRLQVEAERRRMIEARLKEAGSLIEQKRLPQALEIYEEILSNPQSKEFHETIRFRLKSTLDELTLRAAKLQALLGTREPRLEKKSLGELSEFADKLDGLIEPVAPQAIAALDEASRKPDLHPLLARTLRSQGRDFFQKLGARIGRARIVLDDARALIQQRYRYDELERTLEQAQQAESDEEFELALGLYRRLLEQKDIPGREIFERRAARLTTIVSHLQGIEQATDNLDFDQAVEHYQALCENYPNLRILERITLPFLIRSIPTGALVRDGDKVLGKTPLPIRFTPAAKVTLTLERKGFLPQSFVLSGLERGTFTAILPREFLWHAKTGGAIAAQPIILGQKAVLCDRNGKLHSIDLGAMRISWSCQLTQSVGGLKAVPWRHDDQFYAMNFEGRLLHCKLDGSDPRDEGAVLLTPPFLGPVHSADSLWAASQGTLLRISPERPDEPQSIAMGAPILRIWASLLEVWVALRDGRVRAISSEDGTSRWKIKLNAPAIFLVPTEEQLYIFSSDSQLTVCSRLSGEVRWRVSLDSAPAQNPVVLDDRIYIPLTEKLLIFPAHSGQAGEPRTFETGLITASPRIDSAAGKIYLPTAKGLEVIDAGTGHMLWCFRTESPLAATPILLDGLVFVVTRSGDLYELDTR